MVSYPGGPSYPRRVRRLKSPYTVEVEADDEGTPLRVRLGRTWQDVSLARPPWVVDQVEWREHPVSRRYYRVQPVDAAPMTVYFDFHKREWARQEY